MNEPVAILEGLIVTVQNLASQLLAYLPRTGLAVLVLVLGWLLAKLLHKLVEHTITRLDHLWQW
ncbi:hypothetical protein ACFL3P_02565 [Pseudomonadota bacterium]